MKGRKFLKANRNRTDKNGKRTIKGFKEDKYTTTTWGQILRTDKKYEKKENNFNMQLVK